MVGLEPTTTGTQNRYSTIEPHLMIDIHIDLLIEFIYSTVRLI